MDKSSKRVKKRGVTIRRLAIALLVLIVSLIALYSMSRAPEDRGNPRFFTDQTYNFETLRVLNDVAVAGGDTGETLQTIAHLKAGDAQGWYMAWNATGDRVAALAAGTKDPISKGEALLRAHNYYRSAEFFLAPNDARRPAVWKKNVDAFYAGLNTLGVSYERFEVPYGTHHLNAVYYPGPVGAQKRPLLVIANGYDGTMEELYFSLVAAAHQRGYAVLTYEGPGQGAVLREQHLVFTPDWEKPNGAVLDMFEATHGAPSKIVLIGESLGGYLAPRAAAFDTRINGVVSYDTFFDGGAIASRNVPPFVFWLRDHGYHRTLSYLAKQNTDPGSNWAQQNGMWVFGLNDPFAVLDTFKAYTLAPIAARITADVLILDGADDHFVPADQTEQFKQSLTHAHSVTSIVFDRASGGSEHCQMGAPSLWHAALFDWLSNTFPQPDHVATSGSASETSTPATLAAQ